MNRVPGAMEENTMSTASCKAYFKGHLSMPDPLSNVGLNGANLECKETFRVAVALNGTWVIILLIQERLK